MVVSGGAIAYNPDKPTAVTERMRRRFLTIFITLAAAAAGLPALAYGQDLLPALVRRVKPSAVAIETFDQRGQIVSRGSGFFVAADRVITNRHVIERSTRAEIQTVDGRKFRVRGVLAIDGEGDLAMLQVEIPAGVAVPLPVTRFVPQEGESIVVVGNPFGLEGSVSNGIVSAVREIAGYGRIIQITAPISPGSSGSPVVNMYGQVVGVATLQAAEGQSLNFAVPSERILQMRITEARSFANLTAETERNKRASAERFYSQGVVQLSRDEYARALPFFVNAAEADPSYAEAWYQAGYCYGVLGRHDEALRASRQAAKLRPDWAPAHVNIGVSSYAVGQFKEAAEAYRTAIRLNDTSPETQFALGLSLGRLDQPEEEMLAYRRTLQLKPDHVGAIEKLGESYLKTKRWADAAAMFEQLKSYKPEAKTFNSLGEALYELEKLDDSLMAFNSAVGYDPDFDKARFNLGRTYVKMGDRGMAMVQYEILKNARSDWADRLYILINP